jgi:hypothetical protein
MGRGQRAKSVKVEGEEFRVGALLAKRSVRLASGSGSTPISLSCSNVQISV